MYVTSELMPNGNIKLLAVDEIAPTSENVRSGEYPLTIDIYAITTGTFNENADMLIQWILSEQGQNFIEICGYVRN